jgi:hypothetical protein
MKAGAIVFDRQRHFLLVTRRPESFFEGFDGAASSAPPKFQRSASIRLTTLPPATLLCSCTLHDFRFRSVNGAACYSAAADLADRCLGLAAQRASRALCHAAVPRLARYARCPGPSQHGRLIQDCPFHVDAAVSAATHLLKCLQPLTALEGRCSAAARSRCTPRDVFPRNIYGFKELPAARNFARSKSLRNKRGGHAKPLFGFQPPPFRSTGGRSTLAVGAHTAGSAAAPSETDALVTPLPSPPITPDENTADIVVETLIWGATHRNRRRRESTPSSKPAASARTGFAISASCTRRPPHSWPVASQNKPAASASASGPPGLAPITS